MSCSTRRFQEAERSRVWRKLTLASAMASYCRDTPGASAMAVTALSDTAVDIRRADLTGMAVVIGSEGRGVRQEIMDAATHKLIIPMNLHCESLNAAVASAIVMWQMKQ